MFARSMIALLVLLAGCSVGEVDGPDGPPSMNETTFTSIMRPLVTPKCTGCHAGAQPPNLMSYAALAAGDPRYTQKPGNANILVTKDGGTGQHPAGVTFFDATQKMAVTMWIDNLQ